MSDERKKIADILKTLFRDQVEAGFVLADPAARNLNRDKTVFDPDTSVTFKVQWNPDRDIRSDHAELIKRGIIAAAVDDSVLINRDGKGKPCYLCHKNIHLQNPMEKLLELSLGGRKFQAGANFAPITENHFTVMSNEHRPQPPGEDVIDPMGDILDMTGGVFRAVYNGRAGASIAAHEHFHITTTRFPIEEIKIRTEDVISEDCDIRISQPKYYLPLWVVEGPNRAGIQAAAERVIKEWHSQDEKRNTENIIFTKNEIYRIFIIRRNTEKIRAAGKTGAIAAFECGGIIVASDKDKDFFKNVNLKSVVELLTAIAP